MIRDGYFSCEELVNRLPLFLDGELSGLDDVRMQEHLASCERCLKKYRFEAGMLAGIRFRLQALPIPPGLTGRIVAMIAALPEEE